MVAGEAGSASRRQSFPPKQAAVLIRENSGKISEKIKILRKSLGDKPENKPAWFALGPMSAIRDESANVIHLNNLPPFIFEAVADGGKEFLQDSANPLHALQHDLSVLFGVRQVLAIQDRLQGVADMMIQLRNLSEIVQHFPVPFPGGEQD